MNVTREHVISVVLTDEDWRAFLELHPQPVRWLRERIQESTAPARPMPATIASPSASRHGPSPYMTNGPRSAPCGVQPVR